MLDAFPVLQNGNASPLLVSRNVNADIPSRDDKNRKPAAPRPQITMQLWLLEKCCEFYHSDCLVLEWLLLIDKIRRVS